jgi:DNA (cytosine-5)-methyltransferase 1
VFSASDFGVAQIRKRIYIVGSKSKKINLENFTKKHIVFGDIQEKGLKCINNDFTKKILSYLDDNQLPMSYLYDKSIRDKRGGNNNLHSWHLQLRGDTHIAQCELLEKMVTERRRKDLAAKKGVPLKDGVGLSKDEMMKIYNGINLDKDIQDLVDKGYLKEYILPTYPSKLYDIVCGRLSFQFTKFLDPQKLCLTLVATDVEHTGVIDCDGIRNLTITECLKLNGFPDTFILDINYRKALDLLGNTVVVPVIKNICDRMIC